MQRISSRDNPLVKRLRALAGSPRACRKFGQTILDGPHLVAAALAAGVQPQTLVCSESGLGSAEIGALVEAVEPGRRVSVDDALFAQLSPVDSPMGLLALIDIPLPEGGPHVGTIVVLDRVQDAGNLGSILRSAAAAGVRSALLTAGCAQAWAPRVLRAGMGAHFSLRIAEQLEAGPALADYEGEIVATVPDAAAQPLFDCALAGDVAWLIGSEGEGLSAAVAALATRRVSIPMPGGSESLNVAAAVAVCLFEQVRQRIRAGS